MRLHLIAILLLTSSVANAQFFTLQGKITGSDGENVPYALIYTPDNAKSTLSNMDGEYDILLPADSLILISIKAFGYKPVDKALNAKSGDIITMNFKLELDIVVSGGVTVTFEKHRNDASAVELKNADVKKAGMVSDDIVHILATLPGVTVNSELSSQYSVRGGSFDENLVYVNGVQIYRPFLTRAGRQEGLSFVNSDLTDEVTFYSGGWKPQHGDKLSSVLDISYKRPQKFEGSATFGLLGGSAHFGGATKNKRLSYIVGGRRKTTRYLLNTLQTNGEYLPEFNDIQSYISLDLSAKENDSTYKSNKRTHLSFLNTYARNRYLVQPANRTTTFGTATNIISLFIAFDGQEIMSYDTYQGSVKLETDLTENHHADFYASLMTTREREFQDVEGGYRLCDINPTQNGSTFNDCVFERGVGTLYDYSRNMLDAAIYSAGYEGSYSKGDSAKHSWRWGFGYSYQDVNDQLNEYSFIDSSNYITITHLLNGSIDIDANRGYAFVQDNVKIGEGNLVAGVRANYLDVNNQLLISPRLQYAWKSKKEDKDIVFKIATGVYQQPPFYREWRRFDGSINKDLKAQTSYHFILGRDQNFEAWDRPFKFTSEIYYKHMTNLVPYDIDNIRLRYYGENLSDGFAYGADFRIAGEFVHGEQSWFSLGILNTREDVQGDGRGYIRRPTDQRVNFGIFFQDHLRKNPTLKMNLNLMFGSGLPFGPPNSPEFRNSFDAPSYKRVDVGFSKLITFRDKELKPNATFESLYLALEVLNIIAAQNTISYIWISDVQGSQFAVPNTLSQRFLNFKLYLKF